MSTSFEIIPTETVDITFGQVIETSERNILAFLKSIGIEHSIQLRINLHSNNQKYVKEIRMTDKFEWGENEYVWFTIDGSGGTDAYCDNIEASDIDPENPWWKLDYLEKNNTKIENIKEKLAKSKKLNRQWRLSLSSGQPGLICLSYGIISASVAELTNGILWCDDGAWESECFPTESNDFLSWYLRPEKVISPDFALYAKECIEEINEELTAPKITLPKPRRLWWQRLFSSK